MEEDQVAPVGDQSKPRKGFSWPRFGPNALAPAVSLLTLGLSLLLAAYAQNRLDAGVSISLPVVAYLVAATCFGLAARRIGLENDRQSDVATGLSTLRLSRLAPGLIVGFLSFFAFGGNIFRPLGLLAWLGGIALCLMAIRMGIERRSDTERPPTQRLIQAGGLHVSWEWVGLGTITLIGAALRLYRLSEIPADMGWDLPYNYFDADRILHGDYWVFFPHNLGREGLFFYLIALCSRVFGLSPFSIQVSSAVIGILTIPVVYLLAKALFKTEVALYATALLAVSKWHIVLSRSGFRVILMPFFSALVLYFLVRALTTHGTMHFAWLGIATGMGLHSYKAFLFVPPITALAVSVYLLLHKKERCRTLVKGFGITLAITLLVYVPMGRYLWDNPQSYFQREAVQFSTIKEGFAEGGSPLLDTLRNLRTSLLMFNHIGDGNSRFNVPYQRHMGSVSGVLLVLGLGCAVLRFKRGAVSVLLVFWLLLILPMTVTMIPGGIPNLFRSSGVIGPAVIIAALPLATLRRWFAERFRVRPGIPLIVRLGSESESGSRMREWRAKLSFGWIPVALVLAPLFRESTESCRFYFTDYVKYLPDVWNFSLSKEMAKTIEGFTDGPTYIAVWPHWYDGHALRVHLSAKGHAWDGELMDLTSEIPTLTGSQGKALFISHPQDKRAEQLLRENCPQGVLVNRLSPNGDVAYRQYYCER